MKTVLRIDRIEMDIELEHHPNNLPKAEFVVTLWHQNYSARGRYETPEGAIRYAYDSLRALGSQIPVDFLEHRR